MLDKDFIEENIYPFLSGMGATIVLYGFFKLSKFCCC